eukprot:Gb_32094 [translate_table: standard]
MFYFTFRNTNSLLGTDILTIYSSCLGPALKSVTYWRPEAFTSTGTIVGHTLEP